ncbi:prolyl aminopeptidase [Methylohalobius crimeensis]|uniref:prolyl aminopeptidase n=1 Tax=Methylohalobius crimeensis TaxID=244365 RepID=UPI0003B7781F|nr:prolyl aminopeptidase [Methylohalobius crimeensis]
MKTLYPPLEPYAVHQLEADGHRIYYEECGHPEGIPVLFLHGGPGSGCRPDHRRFFDPKHYRVILLDQRGCGRSEPVGELRHNDTWKLVEDLETVRARLRINRWLLFGGSWGAALALLYAQQHPERSLGLILRGLFLARQMDLDWFVRDGARRIYPDYWHQLVKSLPVSGWNDLIEGMYKAVTGHNEALQLRVVEAWNRWGAAVTLGADFDPDALQDPELLLPKTKIELHYAAHRYFVEENQILRDCHRIRTLPCIILHGRQDLVCPVETAFSLRRRLPGARLRILAHAGHIAAGEEMIDALVDATDQMAEQLA